MTNKENLYGEKQVKVYKRIYDYYEYEARL